MGGAKGLAYCGGKSGVGAKRWCQVPMIWGAFREWAEIQMLKKKRHLILGSEGADVE